MPDRLGPYRLIKALGHGGMGAVYLAEDTQLRRPTALKVMLPSVAIDAQSRERFLREARAAAAIRNDHVVTVYQVGEESGTPFIAMELLRGAPLDAYLAKEPAPTMTAVVRLAREIASGLAAAHEKGLVHRDIKPANIWLEAPKGRVKILDFGLARPAKPDREDAERLTHDGMVIGTPSFMSPEQARGEAVDFRTDLFSLGTVLYRLCTGHLPFSGPTTLAVLTQLAIDNPPPASEVNPQVPAALSELIDRLLKKDPADRPKSARAVADELRHDGPDIASARNGHHDGSPSSAGGRCRYREGFAADANSSPPAPQATADDRLAHGNRGRAGAGLTGDWCALRHLQGDSGSKDGNQAHGGDRGIDAYAPRVDDEAIEPAGRFAG